MLVPDGMCIWKDNPPEDRDEFWMNVPNPMVTFFKTFDVTNLVKVNRKKT